MPSIPLFRAARRLPAAVLIIAACGLLWPAPASAQQPTRLVLAAYGDLAESQVAIVVLTEAYRRLGISLDIQHFAGDLGDDRINNGVVDGMVARSDGIETRFPNTIQVAVPIAYVDVAVYSRDSTLRVRDWRDLQSVTVATVRGVYFLERSVGDLHVRLVDTNAELYPLLLNREVEAIVASDLQSRLVLRPMPAAVARNGIIASYMLYHYLHNKHADLVPRLELVLKEMVTDGTVARLREATIAEMARTRNLRAR